MVRKAQFEFDRTGRAARRIGRQGPHIVQARTRNQRDIEADRLLDFDSTTGRLVAATAGANLTPVGALHERRPNQLQRRRDGQDHPDRRDNHHSGDHR